MAAYLRVALTAYCTALLLPYGTDTRPAASASDVMLVTHSKPPAAATLTGCCIAATSVLPFKVVAGVVAIAGAGTVSCCGGWVVSVAASQPVAMTWIDAVAWAVAAPPSGTAVAVLVICKKGPHHAYTHILTLLLSLNGWLQHTCQHKLKYDAFGLVPPGNQCGEHTDGASSLTSSMQECGHRSSLFVSVAP